jgi:hypothetical protein
VTAVATLVAALYALWVCFLAVMNLRRAREAGRLTRPALVLAAPLLLVGFIGDVLINLVLATLVFVDRPREWTVSARLSRYLPRDDWRARVAMWIALHLLDPFDPSGRHLR